MALKRSASEAAAAPSETLERHGRTEALWRLERAGFLMKHSTSTIVANFGLSFSEHTTLSSLLMDNEDVPLTQTQLVELTGSSPSAMTSRIDRLEARGLVQRAPDPRDRRATVVRLTPAGLDLVWRALEAVDEAQQALLKDFTAEESAAFVSLLRKLTASLDFADRYA